MLLYSYENGCQQLRFFFGLIKIEGTSCALLSFTLEVFHNTLLLSIQLLFLEYSVCSTHCTPKTIAVLIFDLLLCSTAVDQIFSMSHLTLLCKLKHCILFIYLKSYKRKYSFHFKEEYHVLI
jgi:hypothetical protein